MVDAADFTGLQKHLTLTSAADIESIVMPVLRQHGITFFNFYKEFYDGSVIRLSNNSQWAEHYFKKGYLKKTNKIPVLYLQNKLEFFIWHTNDWPEMLIDAASNFGIGNGISIIRYQPEGIEYFGFATDIANHLIVNCFYLQNLEWLNQFCDFFKEQARDLIAKFERDKIILSEYIEKKPFVAPQIITTKTSVLTNRQIACSRLLLQGLTVKEIAAKLFLSPRTVETHLNTIKDKLDCRNKTELIIRLQSMLLVES